MPVPGSFNKNICWHIWIVLFALLMASGCSQAIIQAMNRVQLTQLSIQDNKLYILGDFNTLSYNQVWDVVENNPDISVVVLTANSGSLDDETTFKLARYIHKKGLDTHLLSQSVIASGAVDFFLAGKSRTIETGAKLGVHSWSDGSKQAKDFPRGHPEHTVNANYIKDMTGNDEFYWFTVYAAPADSIYWMKTEEIEKYKLATTGFLHPQYDKTPFGEAFVKEREAILAE